MENFKAISQMKPGESGVVIEFLGGKGLKQRLESLGLRVGKRVTKVSSQIWRGPQVIRIGNTQIALGLGVANKILVKIE